MNEKKLFYTVFISFIVFVGLIFYKVNLVKEAEYDFVDNNLVTDSSTIFNSDDLTKKKIEQIRSTANTDISGRTGKIYYVSNSGNDSNDGLSASKPWKTISKINSLFNSAFFNHGDTILFNDGDTFRGNISINRSNLLFGSYGDISKGKPIINSSPYDGAKEGEWTLVKPNIWKYTVNGENPFKLSVGVVWGFCKEGNNNCSSSMDNYPLKFSYSQLITTRSDFDETGLDISTILKNDLESYQMGHSTAGVATGGELYLYSTVNPKDRFDEIEFALGGNTFKIGGNSDTIVDNLKIMFTGSHGVGSASVANLKVTNSEFGFIGGSVQHYNRIDATRYGNAIEIYGSVMDKTGYPVKDGFIIDNCYIYQVYDAGMTFQITTDVLTKIEKAVFSNNVVEYCNYNVEYWNYTASLKPDEYNNSYIGSFDIKNNIMRYSGYGISQTRPDKGNAAFLKSWWHWRCNNIVKDHFKIENNVFDNAHDQSIYITADHETDYPVFKNNVFNNYMNGYFGYLFTDDDLKVKYPYDIYTLNNSFPNNNFLYKQSSYTFSGTSGDVNWLFNPNTEILTVDGDGKMADYTASSLPAWNQYANNIKGVVIGEKVNYLGKYAFYNLKYAESLTINSVFLNDLSQSDANTGSNYTFYNYGVSWNGVKLVFGPKVTIIPAMLTWPYSNGGVAPNITSVVFQGNGITEIKNHGLSGLKVSSLKLPEGIKKISALSLGNMSKIKVLVLPDSLSDISGWSMGSNSSLEKIVLGKNVSKINGSTFSGSNSLKSLIIPGSVTFSGTYPGLFSATSDSIIYGNDSVKKIVDDYGTNTSSSNIKYSTLANYQIMVSSNGSLTTSSSTNYGSNYSFKVNVPINKELSSIRAYEYYDVDDTRYVIGAVSITKNNGVYSLPGLRNNVYIETTFKDKVVEPDVSSEPDKPNPSVDSGNVPIEPVSSDSKVIVDDSHVVVPTDKVVTPGSNPMTNPGPVIITSEDQDSKDKSSDKEKSDILDVLKKIVPTGSDEIDVFDDNPVNDISTSKSNKSILIIGSIVVVSIAAVAFLIIRKNKYNKSENIDN